MRKKSITFSFIILLFSVFMVNGEEIAEGCYDSDYGDDPPGGDYDPDGGEDPETAGYVLGYESEGDKFIIITDAKEKFSGAKKEYLAERSCFNGHSWLDFYNCEGELKSQEVLVTDYDGKAVSPAEVDFQNSIGELRQRNGKIYAVSWYCDGKSHHIGGMEDSMGRADLREFGKEVASEFAKAGPYCSSDVADFVKLSLAEGADSRGFLKQPNLLVMERKNPELAKCLDALEGKVDGRSIMSRQEFRKKLSDFVNTYNDGLSTEDYGAYAKTDSEYSSKSFTGGFAGAFGNSGFFVMLVAAFFIGLFAGKAHKGKKKRR